mmetsp:Transcript_28000/g.69558  ORF Transcript_28000/g.69558 Transcript_28000/m.69558 type:complete len:252 (+) Transcript_28000:1-756(+)
MITAGLWRVGGAAARRFSSAALPRLTLEQALTSSHMIHSAIESPPALQLLRAARERTDAAEKWQLVNQVLIQATLQVSTSLGFPASAQGFEAYTRAFSDLLRTDSDEARRALQQTVDARWAMLLRHGYGCDPAPPLTLQQARALVIDLVDSLQEPELLRQLDGSSAGLTGRLSTEERQTMVGRILVQEQMKVLGTHGFRGAEGFAQAQVCLMAHASDAVVTAALASAMQNLYARAGIDLMAALRQATTAAT